MASDDKSPAKSKPRRMTQHLKDMIEGALRDVGGRAYLARVARRRPDVFLALVAKIIPQETRSTVLAQYAAIPMRVVVEERDGVISAPATANAVLEASVTVTERFPAADDVKAPAESAKPFPRIKGDRYEADLGPVDDPAEADF